MFGDGCDHFARGFMHCCRSGKTLLALKALWGFDGELRPRQALALERFPEIALLPSFLAPQANAVIPAGGAASWCSDSAKRRRRQSNKEMLHAALHGCSGKRLKLTPLSELVVWVENPSDTAGLAG